MERIRMKRGLYTFGPSHMIWCSWIYNPYARGRWCKTSYGAGQSSCGGRWYLDILKLLKHFKLLKLLKHMELLACILLLCHTPWLSSETGPLKIQNTQANYSLSGSKHPTNNPNNYPHARSKTTHIKSSNSQVFKRKHNL